MNKLYKRVSFFVILALNLNFCFVATGKIAAQKLEIVNHLSIEQGLPSNFVYDLLQDQQGYLWILTNVGISNYDGRQLESTNIPANLFHLEGQSKLIEYDEEQLWIIRYADVIIGGESHVSNGNLIIYDKTSKQFCSFESSFPNAPFESNSITYVSSTKEHFLVITTNNALYRLKNGEFELIFQAKNKKFSFATKIKNQYWLQSSSDLFQLKDNHLQLKSTSDLSNIACYVSASEDSVYFAKFAPKDKNILLHTYPQGKVTKIPTDESLTGISYLDDRLYYTTDNTIFYFENEKKIVLDFQEALNVKAFSMRGVKLLSDGKLAIYGINNGISIVEQQRQYFEHIQSDEEVISTRAMLPLNDSILLVNSYTGQLLANSKTKEIENFLPTHSPDGGVQSFHGYDLALDSTGQLWSTTNNFIVTRQDTASIEQINRYYKVKHPEQFICKTRNLYLDDLTAHLLVGTTHGLFYFDESLDSFLLYEKGTYSKELSRTTIHNIRAFGDSLWICTDIGLFSKNSLQGISSYLPTPSFEINDLYIDSKQRFWLATKRNGVLLWDIHEGVMQEFNTKNGLSNDNVTCIYPDAHENLWIPSFHGLNYLDTRDLVIRSFLKDSGIAHNEFNNRSHYLSVDSLLYLGGVNGITIVDVSYQANLLAQKINIPFIAKQIELYDKKTQRFARIEIKDSMQIDIPYAAKGLLIKLNLLDFGGKKNFEYKYRVENLDNTWVHKKNDQLELVTPPIGEYTIYLKAKSNNGRWSSNEIRIPIRVEKPIYFSWWFLLISSIGLGGVSYGSIQLLLYQARREKNRLEQEVQKRTQEIEEDKRIIADQLKTIKKVQASKEKIYRIIGHDLRSPLFGMRNLTQKIDYLVANGRIAELRMLTQRFDKNVENIQQLLDQLLVWTQLEQGEYQIEPNIVNLNTVITRTVDLYEPLIQKKNLQLDLNIRSNAEVFADPHSLSTVVRNLVDNAIKHTPDEGIIEIKAQCCQFSITNQGIKMPSNIISYLETPDSKATYSSKGLGLQICRELVSLNKGKITVQNEAPNATKINVEFTYQ
ncbi:MAG: ATP-binding protein [Bacteroidota bacterium]